jgi:hypothetical protein
LSYIDFFIHIKYFMVSNSIGYYFYKRISIEYEFLMRIIVLFTFKMKKLNGHNNY